MPTLSAVITNYNHSKLIGGALGDIIGQTVPFDEILVVDDASTDNSVEAINALIENVPYARLAQNPKNLGVVATLNHALQEAKGDYIYFVAADDRYSKNIVEICRSLLAHHHPLSMISGNARTVVEETGAERVFTLPFPQTAAKRTRDDISAIASKRSFTFHGGANLIRKDALLALGGQWPELKWNADWLMYLLLTIREPFATVPEECVRITLAKGQYSHASKQWKNQAPMIAAIIRLCRKRCPEEYAFLRTHALLPEYDPRAIWLLLTHTDLRNYLTPKLFWRLLTYKLFKALGAGLPIGLKHKLRKWVGV